MKGDILKLEERKDRRINEKKRSGKEDKTLEEGLKKEKTKYKKKIPLS